MGGPRFKPGDRVRVLYDGAESAAVSAGDVGTVESYDDAGPKGLYSVAIDGQDTTWLLYESSLEPGEQQVPRVGERVRVTETGEGYSAVVEGTVLGVWEDSKTFRVGSAQHPFWRTRTFSFRGGWNLTVERLPDPEPEWQPGDVAVIGSHTLLLPPTPTSGPAFTRTPWWWCSCGEGHSPSEMSADWRAGNVLHVLRDGKPVGGAA